MIEPAISNTNLVMESRHSSSLYRDYEQKESGRQKNQAQLEPVQLWKSQRNWKSGPTTAREKASKRDRCAALCTVGLLESRPTFLSFRGQDFEPLSAFSIRFSILLGTGPDPHILEPRDETPRDKPKKLLQ
jgi:hypothetical protein